MTSRPPATRNKSRVKRALRICSRVVLRVRNQQSSFKHARVSLTSASLEISPFEKDC
ncbi:hypothetical protein PO909_017752 [Leuciscus waleckii]